MGHQKKFSSAYFLFAVVTALLSCCCSPASSFTFLPRVSRTKDAVVIDCIFKLTSPLIYDSTTIVESNVHVYCLNSVDYVGYAPFYHGKTLYGQIANPALVPVPSFHPYPMAYRQQQQDSNGWSYSFSYPSVIDSFDKQGGATPAPVIQCGKGPTALPTRSSIGQRVAGDGATAAKANAWPFVVS